MVLGIEQEKLHSQAPRAALIVAKSGDVQHYTTYLAAMAMPMAMAMGMAMAARYVV